MNIAALETMLAKGTDTPLLRFGLGKTYLDAGNAPQAVLHLHACVENDPGYSAAWKLLGKAYLLCEDKVAAQTAWTAGIAAAQQHGDKQAEKEMAVFLRKLQKNGHSNNI
ncbi:hypothetical protein E9531_08215 [Lampropedia puyangensis]|uniref:Tetratricopeptide repeat protein n=1 Tax=Lampropedia puyangensis TaxID=1330072 RepID=A0A4S8F6V1_9BURK|nr:hypothetical protein [Lampropedia puyangensis]THU01974.1 hypothetical protein E9531_08215 [Lampropedia puyangensis]